MKVHRPTYSERTAGLWCAVQAAQAAHRVFLRERAKWRISYAAGDSYGMDWAKSRRGSMMDAVRLAVRGEAECFRRCSVWWNYQKAQGKAAEALS